MIYDHAPNENYTCNAKRKAKKEYKFCTIIEDWMQRTFFSDPLCFQNSSDVDCMH